MAAVRKHRGAVRQGRVPESVLAWLGLSNSGSLRLLTLLAMTLVSGLTVVYLSHRDRVLFTELQVMRDRANELEVQWGQLLIEQSSLGIGGRVEQRAIEQLDMQVPDINDIILVTYEQAGQ